ncbi:hypothetical protein LB505_000629 [Fusarium chuoi]|nr:hypothetical protein LB505_000629 [Fusarium chuoi]
MVRALRRVKESQGEDLIDLTEDELKDIEKDPELIKRYIIAEDGPEPTANDKGPEFMTRSQAEKLDEAVDEAWEAELDKIVVRVRSSPRTLSSFRMAPQALIGPTRLRHLISVRSLVSKACTSTPLTPRIRARMTRASTRRSSA